MANWMIKKSYIYYPGSDETVRCEMMCSPECKRIIRVNDPNIVYILTYDPVRICVDGSLLVAKILNLCMPCAIQEFPELQSRKQSVPIAS